MSRYSQIAEYGDLERHRQVEQDLCDAAKQRTIMKQRFINHIESIQDTALRACCREIQNVPAFFTHPAALKHHHAYEGGLLAHTVEVCDYARHIAECMGGQEDTDILIAACLWHDFMKVREYEITAMGREILEDEGSLRGTAKCLWTHTNYGKLIHNIPGSAIEFTVAARKHGVTEDVIEQVQHCILAHHGRKEWGSPVEPQTIEALILHQADMLSAKFGATKDKAP